jgi:hypothetical protein
MTGQHRPMSRRTAERMLAGGAVGADHERLATLLSAAAAVRSGAQPGEQQAVRAFHAASLAPARPARVGLRRILAVKVAAAVALFAAGGVAVAATTGHLPGPLGGPHPATSPGPSAGSSGARPDASPGPSASEDAMVGLCRAYTARGPVERGKVLETSAFRTLVEAAGGRDLVEPYCSTVLAAADGSGRSAKPKKTPGPVGPSHAGQPRPTHPAGTPARATPTVTKRPGR